MLFCSNDLCNMLNIRFLYKYNIELQIGVSMRGIHGQYAYVSSLEYCIPSEYSVYISGKYIRMAEF